MSDYSRRRHTTGNSGSTPGSTTGVSTGESNSAAIEDMPKEQVMIYLTQNSVTHHKDEIPETLAALQKADQAGLGKKSMIPISDQFSDGTGTEQYAFGESTAASMTWWHDDTSLKAGQVRVGDRVLTLGAHQDDLVESEHWEENGTVKKPVVVQIRKDWQTALTHIGLSAGKADAVIGALMTGQNDTAKMMHSGGGACNELLQLISVLNRAEMGEFEISSFVLSGHHYRGTPYIFGEMGDHEYDDDKVTGDTLDVRDIEKLSTVFPKAFSQVDSMMFSACNTHDLGIQDGEGNERSTQDWVSSTFPEAKRMSNWQDIAPGSDYGAFFSGEFALDVAKEEAGADGNAFDAWQFKKTQKGTNHRFERNGAGDFESMETERSRTSYPHYNEYKGLRNSNHEAFHKREDLMRYILKKL